MSTAMPPARQGKWPPQLDNNGPITHTTTTTITTTTSVGDASIACTSSVVIN
ncbi:hypothetical protein SCLCIDRAFT_1214966 [Scleroderma citrinum Foug A]|uniref:Uncharacterized protein n=1 Tax=Scleroderma citrinum Foug A TaxID=1036808 RepID=A0A0C2ZM76_9AGAM|nr:hypothetical protein SCLCIDRAFT_1214966 [Scleroderma citrinum Foug A]